MSYAAFITTQREANNYINNKVCLQSPLSLQKLIINVSEQENMYLIVKKNEFTPPYYPTKKGRAWKDKTSFVEVLKNVNEDYLIKKLCFMFLGEDEAIHRVEICDFEELIEFINSDNIEANVLYKVKHSYKDYNK